MQPSFPDFLTQLLIINASSLYDQLVLLSGCQETGTAVLISISKDTRFTSFDPIPDGLLIDSGFPADFNDAPAFRWQPLSLKHCALRHASNP